MKNKNNILFLRKEILALVIILCFVSCNNSNKKSNNKVSYINDSILIKSEISNKNNQSDYIFSLDLMSELPDDFDGRGSFLTYDSININDNKYIFMSNLHGIAVIKINGNYIYLKEDSTQSSVRIDNYYKERWKGGSFQIDINMRVVRDEEEILYLEGFMYVNTNNKKQKIKVHGTYEV